jgi:glucosylceramidase
MPRHTLNPSQPSGPIRTWVTSGEKRYSPGPVVAWSAGTGSTKAAIIDLHFDRQHQEILGFGAAFTDASCYMFSQLAPDARQALLHDLFDPSAMNLNVCRTCIGASDYSTEVFGYDEGDPDPELKRFSIEHDRSYVLPTLKDARKINPDLFLFSSPWSPPGWMKANGSMLGGSMRKKHLASYAQHFVKFIQAYSAEGVPIQAVTSQNEVDTDQDGRMPACLWGQEYEIEFIAKHLGPALAASGLTTKIWLLDHNYNLWGRVICSLDDPGVRKFCNAIAWHGYVGTPEMMLNVRDRHPRVEMHWTEGGPDYTSDNYATDWSTWAQTFIGVLKNGCTSITGWNLALDERGRPNIGPFSCGGLVTIHSRTKEITQSGQYHAFAHFSRNIQRGAHVLGSTSTANNIGHVACKNRDGRKVLIIANPGPVMTVNVRASGASAQFTLEHDSVTTAIWQ